MATEIYRSCQLGGCANSLKPLTFLAPSSTQREDYDDDDDADDDDDDDDELAPQWLRRYKGLVNWAGAQIP